MNHYFLQLKRNAIPVLIEDDDNKETVDSTEQNTYDKRNKTNVCKGKFE